MNEILPVVVTRNDHLSPWELEPGDDNIKVIIIIIVIIVTIIIVIATLFVIVIMFFCAGVFIVDAPR